MCLFVLNIYLFLPPSPPLSKPPLSRYPHPLSPNSHSCLRWFYLFDFFLFASVVGPRSLWWWIFFHLFLIGATLFIGIHFFYFTPFQICVGIFSLVFCLTFYVCQPCFHIIILICLSFSLYSSLAVPSCIRICLYLHLSWCLFYLIQTMFRVRLSIFLKRVDNGRLSRLIVFWFFSFILNFFLPQLSGHAPSDGGFFPLFFHWGNPLHWHFFFYFTPFQICVGIFSVLLCFTCVWVSSGLQDLLRSFTLVRVVSWNVVLEFLSCVCIFRPHLIF